MKDTVTTERTSPASAGSRSDGPAVLAAASLGFAVIQLDVSVVNVAVRSIGAELGGGVAGLQWVVDAYTLAFAGLILTAGSLGDRCGARRMLLCGFGVFTVASMACGLAPDIGSLVAARAVQGAGAAILGACSLALLNHAFPDRAARARAVGIWAAGASAALAAGPLIGGLLIAAAGWRLIFLINMPLGVAGGWLTLRYATETPLARDRGIDLPGQFAAIVALTALAGTTIETGSRRIGCPLIVAGYLLAAATGAWFVLGESRRARPMLPLTLFRSRVPRVCLAIGFGISVAFYGLIFAFSLWLQQAGRFSPLAAGLAFAPVMVGVLAGNLVSGRLGSIRRTLADGAVTMTAGCAGMLATVAASRPAPVAALVGALTVTGIGIGVIVPTMTSALLASVDHSWSGIASGTLTATRQTGSVLGVAVSGSLLAGTGLTAGLELEVAAAGRARRGRGRPGRAGPGQVVSSGLLPASDAAVRTGFSPTPRPPRAAAGGRG